METELTDYENNLTSLVAEEGFEENAGLQERVDLEKAFEDLFVLQETLKNETVEFDEQIKSIIEKKSVIVAKYNPDIKTRLGIIENEIRFRQDSIKCKYGKAIYKHGPTSTKWDDKALLKYADSHEDFSKMVEYFRTVSVGKDSVSISVGELK